VTANAAISTEASAPVPADRIRPVPRADDIAGLVRRFLALPDLTPFVADALDRLSLTEATVPAGLLPPLRPGDRVIGPALTLRYVPARTSVGVARAAGRPPRLGDRDALAAARPGDVLVVETGGNTEDAVLGDRSAARLEAAGVAGCVCAGAIRDVDSLRGSSLPVWSAGRTPRNALHRLETAEINGPVRIGNCTVEAGDLIAADANGLAVIPLALAAEVLVSCEAQAAAEAASTSDNSTDPSKNWSE
jgi:4-hydroxy-4-methyl-2-oxoglutarate aldolase